MSFPLFDLTGKTALITGSSQGIGLALARGLAEHGATVILNGRDEAKLADAQKQLSADGFAVHAVAFDATDQASVAAGIDRIEAEIGAIDILINNAGMQYRSPLED
ncbi:SDR family NAD(P)-dependent oxidoreductase, partial [Rhizobium wenxiniae]